MAIINNNINDVLVLVAAEVNNMKTEWGRGITTRLPMFVVIVTIDDVNKVCNNKMILLLSSIIIIINKMSYFIIITTTTCCI